MDDQGRNDPFCEIKSSVYALSTLSLLINEKNVGGREYFFIFGGGGA